MIKVRHIGMVVELLDASIAFYENVFGFELKSRAHEDVPHYIDKLVNIKDVDVEYAKMEIADGVILELLQYHSHPEKKPEDKYYSNRHGCSHLALTVTDADAIHDQILKNGGSVNSEPLTSPDGNVKVFYAHDIDGIILEIVEPQN